MLRVSGSMCECVTVCEWREDANANANRCESAKMYGLGSGPAAGRMQRKKASQVLAATVTG